MKAIGIILAICSFSRATCTALADAQPESRAEMVSKPGLFTYKLPPGWKIVSLAGIRNPIATDAQNNAFSPYIQVDQVWSPLSLNQFALTNKASLKRTVPSTRFLEEKQFNTSSGLKGIRIVVTCRDGTNDLKAVYFLFQGSQKRKFVILSNCTAAEYNKYAPIFDTAMESFTCE